MWSRDSTDETADTLPRDSTVSRTARRKSGACGAPVRVVVHPHAQLYRRFHGRPVTHDYCDCNILPCQRKTVDGAVEVEQLGDSCAPCCHNRDSAESSVPHRVPAEGHEWLRKEGGGAPNPVSTRYLLGPAHRTVGEGGCAGLDAHRLIVETDAARSNSHSRRLPSGTAGNPPDIGGRTPVGNRRRGADGREAVRLAVEHQSDLAIIDAAMPLLSGIEATKQIVRSLPATRILLLTIYDDEPYVIEALEAGATGYVLKEAADLELVRAADEVIHGRRFVTSLIAYAPRARYLPSGN
jgi:CheY-like chemotaxis protein